MKQAKGWAIAGGMTLGLWIVANIRNFSVLGMETLTCKWELAKHNPNEFTFMLLFWPVGVFLTLLAPRLLWLVNLSVSSRKRIKRVLVAAPFVSAVVAAGIAYTNYSITGVDVFELQPGHRCSAAAFENGMVSKLKEVSEQALTQAASTDPGKPPPTSWREAHTLLLIGDAKDLPALLAYAKQQRGQMGKGLIVHDPKIKMMSVLQVFFAVLPVIFLFFVLAGMFMAKSTMVNQDDFRKQMDMPIFACCLAIGTFALVVPLMFLGFSAAFLFDQDFNISANTTPATALVAVLGILAGLLLRSSSVRTRQAISIVAMLVPVAGHVGPLHKILGVQSNPVTAIVSFLAWFCLLLFVYLANEHLGEPTSERP